MSYKYTINTLRTRQYHGYINEKTVIAQRYYEEYVTQATLLEEETIEQRIALKESLKERKITHAGYNTNYALLIKEYENKKNKEVIPLLDRYEAEVKKLETEGHDILLTDGLVYSVLNRYQSSPKTEILTALYAAVHEAKHIFSTLLVEQYSLDTRKGLDQFIQTYIKGKRNQAEAKAFRDALDVRVKAIHEQTQLMIRKLGAEAILDDRKTSQEARTAARLLLQKTIQALDHNKKSMETTDEQIAGIVKHDERGLDQFEFNLHMDLQRSKLDESLANVHKLEFLIKEFNGSYALRREEFSNTIIQDVDGAFYEDMYARDFSIELMETEQLMADEDDPLERASLVEKQRIIEKQRQERELLQVIDQQNLDKLNPSLTGLCDVSIRVEIHNQVINWFIIAPKDQTTQAFRDVYFRAAANAHGLAEGCSGYYRGTNSLHLKRHHTKVEDAGFNHNHYRFVMDITPKLVSEHMNAILLQEHGGAILDRDRRPIGEEVFMSMERRKGIIDQIVGEYEVFYEAYTEKVQIEEAIDRFNRDLVMSVVGTCCKNLSSISSFESEGVFNVFITESVTKILLRNGITSDQLEKYGPQLFSELARDYELTTPSSSGETTFSFSFDNYCKDYKETASSSASHPKGYHQYDSLKSVSHRHEGTHMYSQQEIYQSSADRQLTPQDADEMDAAKLHEELCKNAAHDPIRGFGSFMAAFRSTAKKSQPLVAQFGLFSPVVGAPTTKGKSGPDQMKPKLMQKP